MNQEESCCPNANQELETIIEPMLDTEEIFLTNKETRSQERLAICKECPELRALNNCRQCGCFMNIKTRIYSATCPLGKW